MQKDNKLAGTGQDSFPTTWNSSRTSGGGSSIRNITPEEEYYPENLQSSQEIQIANQEELGAFYGLVFEEISVDQVEAEILAESQRF
jgi:hypothetical protein